MSQSINWDLVVPQALLADGRLVTPDEVTRQHGPFACPECKSEVVLRWGKWVQRHFAHTADSECSLVAAGESWWHKSAKALVVNSIRDWLERGTREPSVAPVLCKTCMGRGPTAGGGLRRLSDLAPGIVRAEEEVHRPDVPVVPDVGAFDASGEMILAVELVRTHAMGAQKIASYRLSRMPWFEIDATDLMNRGGFVWRPFRTWRSPAGRCEECGGEAETPEKAHVSVARDGEYGSTGTEALDAYEADLVVRIDAGEIRESPFGPLFTPPARVDRKGLRGQSAVRDALGRNVAAYEDGMYARRVAAMYNRVSEHLDRAMRRAGGGLR